MASYISRQQDWPYFCFQGPSTNTPTNYIWIAANAGSFFNTNLESSYTPYTPFTNGIFTAPIKGLYYFEIILNCLNNDNTNDSYNADPLGFVSTSNGVVSIISSSYEGEDVTRSSTTVEHVARISGIVTLQEGDTVKLYDSSFTSGRDFIQNYLASRNYFMGYMISAFS